VFRIRFSEERKSQSQHGGVGCLPEIGPDSLELQ
jgi:hypothetical protein